MWKSIMNDLKNSTLGERILLGIIAGLFAVVGFYVGYEHLSNGVTPVLIGSITAVVVMIGCMAAAFIIEELIRKIPSRKKHEENREKPLFDSQSKLPAGEEFNDADADLTKTITKGFTRPSFMKSKPSLEETTVTKEENVTEEVKSSPEWEAEEKVEIPAKPVAPEKPRGRRAQGQPATQAITTVDQTVAENIEAKEEAPKLTDFIKAHPELSARKMVKEYRLAGGTDSTEDILNLMN